MNVKLRTSPNGQPDATAPGLIVLGDIGIDMVMGPLPEWPRIGVETLMPRSDMRAGGSAGNAALALQALGAPVCMLSAAGNDALGLWLKSQFAGIDAVVATCDTATAVSVGIVHACGERNFFTTHGHLDHQDWSQFVTFVPPARDEGAIALLTGVFLLPRLRANYGHILSHLRHLGYQIALDTGWPPETWTGSVVAETRAWLAQVDHVLLNELEITALAGDDDLDTAMTQVSSWLAPGACLVAKIGRRGAIGISGGVRSTASPPPSADSIFDTIGAGDAFNAGYLHARSRGAAMADALRMGCETATRIIAQFPRQHMALFQPEGA